MKGKLKYLLVLGFLFVQNQMYAQATMVAGFKALVDNWLKPLFPVIALACFIIGALFGLGDIMGDNKDWKKFFTKVGMFGLALTAVSGAVVFISSWTL